jgi:hypothetical protein
MQGARNAGTVIVRERADARNRELEFFPTHGGVEKIDGFLDIPCFGGTTEVNHDFEQIRQPGLVQERLSHRQGQHFQQQVEIVNRFNSADKWGVVVRNVHFHGHTTLPVFTSRTGITTAG